MNGIILLMTKYFNVENNFEVQIESFKGAVYKTKKVHNLKLVKK